MATPASKLMLPTQFHEQQLAAERATENGRVIFTMWLIVNLIERSFRDFHLTDTCKLILAKFSNLTYLDDMKISFDQADNDFLDIFANEFKHQYLSNNVEHHETPCRELWKSYFTKLWRSSNFLKIEMKFATMIVLPRVTMHDGNIFSISDNLRLFEELTKFMKAIELKPSSTQRFISIYNSAGLTGPEKDNLLFSGKKIADIKHQKDVLAGKLTKAKETVKQASFNLADERKRGNFLQQLLEREQEQSKDFIEKINELQKEVDALVIALKKYLDARPAECIICQTLYTSKTSMKSTSCCGTIICDSCYEDLKRHTQQDNPRCPTCRGNTRQDLELVRIPDSHPTIRRLQVCDAETTTDPEDFLAAVIGGPEFELFPIPIPNQKPSYPLSIYAQLLGDQRSDGQACAGGGGGGGGAMSKPNHRRDPPAARGDA